MTIANPHKTLEAAKADRKALEQRLSLMRAEMETATDSKRVRFLRDEIQADERRLSLVDGMIEMAAIVAADQTAKFEDKRTAAIRATPTTLHEIEQLLAQADAAMAEVTGCLDQALEKLASLHPVCNLADARRLLNKAAVCDAAVAAGLNRWLPLAAVEGISKPNLKSAFTMCIQPTVRNEAQRMQAKAKEAA